MKSVIENPMNSIIIVVGLGRSGIGAAKLLNQQGKKVVIIEKSNDEKFESISKELNDLGITVELGIPLEFSSFEPWLKDLSRVVISPSVPWDHPTLNNLRIQGIKVQSEISLAWEELKHIPWIAITGTNGKTTVTKMLKHVLEKNKIKTSMGGNVGISVSDIALEVNNNQTKLPSWLIIELSSYQIETAPEITPAIGIWTTFSADHLERHKSLENYFAIKKGLLEKASIRIYNSDDRFLKSQLNKLRNGIWISATRRNKFINTNKFWINKEGIICEEEKELFDSSVIQLPGKHNLQNLLMVVSAAREVGLSPKAIEKGIKDFKGIPHRLEFIGQIESTKIFNDSKATNYEAARIGLEAINSPLLVLAGGESKEGDESSWLNQLNKSCSGVFLFGSSAKLLKDKIKASGFKKEITIFKDLKEATNAALALGVKKKVPSIILSPACSSFDQYKDFEERGNHFKEIIKPFLKANQTKKT